MTTRRAILFTAASTTLAVPAHAAYPDRPIRVVVPFAAGGNTDILARILTTRMAERLGRPMVIDNRTGAGGSVGAEAVAKATPDGYTLLFGAGGPLTANPVLQANLPYDVARDFRPIGLVGILPMICQVGPRITARRLADFVAILRQRPGQVTIATPGAGSAAHLALELLMAAANVRAVHVPYRGGSAMIADLVSGTVDAGMVELPSALPLHLDGKAPIIGIATLTRSAVLPDVQTFIEAGLPGFTAGSYGGLLAPAATPADVVATLHGALAATLGEPAVQSRIAEVGAIPAGAAQRSPDGFAAFLANELANARRAAELAGLRPS
jgi:tripartite-type tricarboxylate transporter receptor subunit TctC